VYTDNIIHNIGLNVSSINTNEEPPDFGVNLAKRLTFNDLSIFVEAQKADIDQLDESS
jgi:hypothetical protein